MDVLVMFEESPAHAPVVAHVNLVPSSLKSERPSRDVVTLYAEPSPESVALALAAAMESRRGVEGEGADAMRHLAISPERGAVGDAAWRDNATGQLMTRDLLIPLATLSATATRLLAERGPEIRRLVAGLRMPDWPEGARRALTFSLAPVAGTLAAVRGGSDALLDMFREADGLAYEFAGD